VSTSPGLLQSGDGRRLLVAQLFDSTGAGIGVVALPWIVLDAGGSASTAGLVVVFGWVPYVLFGLLAGVTGDRRSRRKVIVSAHAIQTLAAAAVPLWAIWGSSTPEALVLAVAFAVGIARTFADAAAFGAIGQIVGPAQFGRAQGLVSTVWATGMVSGPAVGGQLIGLFGPSTAISVQCAAFGLAALCAAAIRSPLRPPAPNSGGLREAMREGIDVILHTPVVRRITATTTLWNVAFYGSVALVVPFLRDVIHLDGGRVGWVLGVGSVVGIATGPVIVWLEGRMSAAVVIVVSLVVSGLTVLAMAVATAFWQVLAIWIVLSLAQWVSFTTAIGERQRHAPAHLQARVGITGRAIAIGSMTAGATIASLLANVVGLRTLYVGIGVATLLVGLYAGPRLLRGPGSTLAAAGD
jgi:predicted MFS family arabinose efflux permease